ncbi:hypothetical protein SLS55_002941 [Diplodia seriata]|uniref:Uncharacterized protein n=1 Tax=Diplodia seriata TaxID=420778 RepID=A0ABR3CMJ8_9PEZI
MSFGVSVGDVVAVGDLCWKLYRNVVEVSGNAPAELRASEEEMGILNKIMELLPAGGSPPDSVVNQSEQETLNLAGQILSQTEKIRK